PAIHARRRARNSASAGESRKSIGSSEPVVTEAEQLLTVVAEPLRGEQRAPQVDVRETLPRVADPAVDLDPGLAHGARGPGAVRLGDAPGPERRMRLEVVDRP